jgi:hypothetical protein
MKTTTTTTTTTKNPMATLGNITKAQLMKDVSVLRETETNQASVIMGWNTNLVAEKKWYDVSNGSLPIEFQAVTKSTLANEYFGKPENAGLIGRFITDGKVKRVDENTFNAHKGEKLDVTLNLIINGDLKNIKENQGGALADVVKDSRRKFTKDFWDKKLNNWKTLGKTLDNAEGDVETLKKEKATRTFIEMLQWNILGEPDTHNAEPYANALLRKAINSKDPKADKKVFEKIFKKALVDYENAVTISSDEARDVIKAITK